MDTYVKHPLKIKNMFFIKNRDSMLFLNESLGEDYTYTWSRIDDILTIVTHKSAAESFSYIEARGIKNAIPQTIVIKDIPGAKPILYAVVDRSGEKLEVIPINQPRADQTTISVHDVIIDF